MRADLIVTSVLVSLLLLGACGGGSGSHDAADAVAGAPEPAVVVPTDYVMPPLVDVIPPSDDFVLACDEFALPPDDELPPPDDDTTVGGNVGYLIDPAVSGLAYETPTRQGLTGPDGSFHYEDGEIVRFMLGETLLGEVAGKAQITPFDLADSRVVTGLRTITNVLDREDHPFHTVINTAVLLQSLDQDADPKTGIKIIPQVAALFRGVSLDLNQHWEAFSQDFGLRYALGHANAQSLFTEARGVVKPAPAIQHLYETLGIDARTFGVGLEQSDGDGDGTPGDISSWQYDISGNVTRREASGSDGRLHGLESWTYDTHGNRTRFEQEEYGQESTESWQYDADGNLTRHELDEDGNGTPESYEILRYRYGVDGELTRVKRDVFDENDDDTPGSITTYQYDNDGKLIQVDLNGGGLRLTAELLGIPVIQYLELAQTYTVTWEYDADGHVTGDVLDGFHAAFGTHVVSRQYDEQGNVTRYEGRLQQNLPSPSNETTIFEYEYEYDAQGNVTREVWDEDADGTPDDIISYEYDSNGNVTREASDSDGDGKPDEIISYEYDGSGNVTREITDWNSDGEPDQVTSYEYDALGNLTQLEHDHDADGTTDEAESWPYQYEYDTHGNLVRRILDHSGDGAPDEIVNYAYHASGSLAREERWSTEGAGHDISIWQYDTRGNLTREEFDYGGDGTPDTILNYEYDACGSQIRREVRDIEGSADSVEHWRYDTEGHLRRYEWANRRIQWPYDGNEFLGVFESSQADGFEGWQYDVQGRLTRYHQVECDGDCSGIFIYSVPLRDQIVNYEYDPNGNLTRELRDKDGDRKPDLVISYEYDANGKVTRELRDEDGDGEADWVVSYEYDANNNLTRREADEDGDGTLDYIETRQYDPNGNLIREEIDGNGDGTPEQRTATFEHQYDANGNRTRVEEDEDGDGVADYIVNWEYDANGNETRREQDGNGDGVPNYIETRQYDANGNLIRKEIDGYGDGTPDRIRTYKYDADGNLTRESEAEDIDQDGVLDEFVIRHYMATGWGHIFANPAGD